MPDLFSSCYIFKIIFILYFTNSSKIIIINVTLLLESADNNNTTMLVWIYFHFRRNSGFVSTRITGLFYIILFFKFFIPVHTLTINLSSKALSRVEIKKCFTLNGFQIVLKDPEAQTILLRKLNTHHTQKVPAGWNRVSIVPKHTQHQ